ncbi:hypothetical protein A1O3_00359 [Capronia epimyces CBS 606.96]|uniref:Uncharacterized protein n=1 Tax=Capronia epimyces CBS 606.96 TaxID=1182542 RepID=W9ZB94_9EURO|nr:uncharacterized protein A1O3_00359 [Capronia epimyces CBS 606.96]EXJ91809.1 hypothetical protein A1O3_00359 [Capronia epimyces CBS 606.96]
MLVRHFIRADESAIPPALPLEGYLKAFRTASKTPWSNRLRDKIRRSAMSPKYINKLNGKRVIVVGGTSGIGFATAEAAVEYGAIVVVASSTQSKIDNAVQRMRKSYPDVGDRIRGKAIDLVAANVEDQMTSLFDFATEGGKYSLDHVVYTAGDFFGPTPLSEVTGDKLAASMKLRVTGPLLMAKVAMKYLTLSPLSSFTITSGVMDSKPLPGWAVMAPVVSALKGLTHALAHDLKPIRVNCVCPGAVKTEAFAPLSEDQQTAVVELFKAKSLTNTVGTPQDLAECYLCCMNNAFMTGSELYADGGYLRH